MLIRGGVRYTDNGIKIALKAMQLHGYFEKTILIYMN